MQVVSSAPQHEEKEIDQVLSLMSQISEEAQMILAEEQLSLIREIVLSEAHKGMVTALGIANAMDAHATLRDFSAVLRRVIAPGSYGGLFEVR